MNSLQKIAAPLLAFALFFALAAPGRTADYETISGEKISVRLDKSAGTYDIVKADGSAVVLNAAAEMIFANGKAVSTRDMALESVAILPANEPLGKGQSLNAVFYHEPSGIEARMKVVLYDLTQTVTADLSLLSRRGKNLPLRRIRPLVARGADGAGLFVGADARKTQILEDGGSLQSMPVLDFYISIANGSGASDSNWNSGVYDRASGEALSVGFLTHRRGLTSIRISGAKDAPAIESGGRRAFAEFEALCYYRPSVAPGQNEPLVAETLYIDAAPANIYEGLENYGRATAKQTGKVLWQHGVPMGWNSWSGGGGSGGLGTSITEQIILDNLEVAARDFKKYGLDFFQIDDGYEIVEGQWEHNDKFPHGMKWIADKIREKGFRPGIWIAGLTADHKSQVWKEHPDWFIKRNSLQSSLIPKEWEYFDGSHPEAKQWLHDLFDKVVNQWGFDWVKLDFAYWAMIGGEYYDHEKTGSEIYRDTLKMIRDILGPDRFFLNVAVAGTNFETADAVRISLDNEPWWESEKDEKTAQSIKGTLRTAMRRYYLQNTAMINHNDLIFFRREDPHRPGEPSKIGVTPNEARSFVSFIGLTGGIVKLGEPWTSLTPEQGYQLSRVMPVYGETARPMDLFDREWAEVWDLPVEAPSGDNWHVLGLFNWGRNVDLVAGEEIPEMEHAVTADLNRLGLDGKWLAYSFWDREYLGEVEGKLSKTLAPRSEAVVSLHRKTGVPQFLGTSRHVTMGGTDLLKEEWNEGGQTLNIAFEGIENEPFEAAVYLPDGYRLKQATGSSNLQNLEAKQDGNIVKIKFKTSTDNEIDLAVVCSK